uniref:ZAD domain-containing protein n=1 Tax=Timema poppense TaxID=170557 RepID=A0A7R9DA74_TIMPO|nr:unnamed protein product [Timema poppensis]
MSDVCRICASTTRILLEIFNPLEKRKYAAEINSCLPIKVTPEDTISLKICHVCVQKLERCNKFVQEYKHTESQRRGSTVGQNVCYLCLEARGVLCSLFDDRNWAQKIETALGCKVHNGKRVPSKICHYCAYSIDELNDICHSALESESTLYLTWTPDEVGVHCLKTGLKEIDNKTKSTAEETSPAERQTKRLQGVSMENVIEPSGHLSVQRKSLARKSTVPSRLTASKRGRQNPSRPKNLISSNKLMRLSIQKLESTDINLMLTTPGSLDEPKRKRGRKRAPVNAKARDSFETPTKAKRSGLAAPRSTQSKSPEILAYCSNCNAQLINENLSCDCTLSTNKTKMRSLRQGSVEVVDLIKPSQHTIEFGHKNSTAALKAKQPLKIDNKKRKHDDLDSADNSPRKVQIISLNSNLKKVQKVHVKHLKKREKNQIQSFAYNVRKPKRRSCEACNTSFASTVEGRVHELSHSGNVGLPLIQLHRVKKNSLSELNLSSVPITSEITEENIKYKDESSTGVEESLNINEPLVSSDKGSHLLSSDSTKLLTCNGLERTDPEKEISYSDDKGSQGMAVDVELELSKLVDKVISKDEAIAKKKSSSNGEDVSEPKIDKTPDIPVAENVADVEDLISVSEIKVPDKNKDTLGPKVSSVESIEKNKLESVDSKVPDTAGKTTSDMSKMSVPESGVMSTDQLLSILTVDFDSPSSDSVSQESVKDKVGEVAIEDISRHHQNMGEGGGAFEPTQLPSPPWYASKFDTAHDSRSSSDHPSPEGLSQCYQLNTSLSPPPIKKANI